MESTLLANNNSEICLTFVRLPIARQFASLAVEHPIAAVIATGIDRNLSSEAQHIWGDKVGIEVRPGSASDIADLAVAITSGRTS